MHTMQSWYSIDFLAGIQTIKVTKIMEGMLGSEKGRNLPFLEALEAIGVGLLDGNGDSNANPGGLKRVLVDPSFENTPETTLP